jgi:hypothetical protein
LNKMQWLRLVLINIAFLIIMGFIGMFFLWPREEKKGSVDALKTQAQIVHENRQTQLELPPALQEKVGIVSQPIQVETDSSSLQTAYGAVMVFPDVSDLLSRMEIAQADLSRAKANSISARGAYQKAQATRQSAQAARQKVQVNLDISRKSFERLRTLNADNRNVSAKTVESAEGTYEGTQSDIQATQAQIQSAQADLLAAKGQILLHQADIQAAQGALKSIQEAALQRLGPVIARWMMSNSIQFQQLLQRQDVLVQVMLPALQSPPETLNLKTADQATLLSARYVGPALQVDPKVQGASFTYLASSNQGALLPGMNVIAALSAKSSIPGSQFSIPASAVVWEEGKPWVYVQTSTDRFIRHGVAGKQIQNRWLVNDGFKLGDRVVVQGAQLLLSQEFQSQHQGE